MVGRYRKLVAPEFRRVVAGSDPQLTTQQIFLTLSENVHMRGKRAVWRSLYILVHFGSSSNIEIYKVITSSIKSAKIQHVEWNDEVKTHI